MRYTRDAVAIAAAMSLLLAACGDDADDDSGDTAAPTEAPVTEDTTAESLATETAGLVADASALDWVRVPGGDAFGGSEELYSVTAGGPGLVAVGSDDDVAAVWTSADGVTWTRVAPDDDIFGGEVYSVTAAGPGLVAVGSDGNVAAVWTSPDGVTWTRVPHDDDIFGGQGAQAIHDVAVGGPGLVAVGGHELYRDRAMGAIRAVVWTSPDGLTWTRVPHDDDIFGGVAGDEVDMTAVTAGGPGLVAVGGAVWTSPDGQEWSRVPIDTSVFGGIVPGGHDERMTSVVAAEAGIVAVGHSGGHAAVWTSPDGVDWSRVPHDDLFGLESMEDITTGGSQYVAVGGSAGLAPTTGVWTAAVWTSPDGLTWTAHHDSAFENGYLYSATAFGSTIIAVGASRRCEPRSEVPVWLATAVDDAAVIPDDHSDAAADATAPAEAVVEDEAVLEAVDGDGAAHAEGTWSLVASGDAAVMDLNAVVAGGPGLVAVGADEDLPAVWTSVDGVTWMRATDVPLACVGGPGFGGLQTVGGGDPGFVALQPGSGPFGLGESAVWTSSDGLTWTYVGAVESVFGDDARVKDLIAGGPGFVAVGFAEAGDQVRAVVWTSPDGLAWTRVTHDDAMFDDATIEAVTEAGPGLVAVGTTGFIGGVGAAAVWTSPDGLTWTRVAHDVATFDDAWMRAVTAGGPGLVAVGEAGWLPPDHEPAGAVWTSPDGLTWTRLPDVAFDGQGTGPLGTVVGVNGHLVAIDEGSTPWYSTDGTTWSAIPLAGEQPPGHGEIRSATVEDTAVVGVGVIGCPRCRAAVWSFTVPAR